MLFIESEWENVIDTINLLHKWNMWVNVLLGHSCWLIFHSSIRNLFFAQNRLLKHLSEIYYFFQSKMKTLCKIINLDQSQFDIFPQIWIERTFVIMEHDVGHVQHNGSHSNSARIDSCAQKLWTLSLRVRSKVSINFFYQLIIGDSLFFGTGVGKW
jgi:hypothetical protein